jgi:hypothetical protein
MSLETLEGLSDDPQAGPRSGGLSHSPSRFRFAVIPTLLLDHLEGRQPAQWRGTDPFLAQDFLSRAGEALSGREPRLGCKARDTWRIKRSDS